jgi:hypothetical protein
MNKTEISTDGVCVYVMSTMDVGRGVKLFVRIALLAIVAGYIIMAVSESNSPTFTLGLFLLLAGLVVTLPMGRTILWNLYGQEYLSFSTKSIAQELSFGLFKLPVQNYVYDDRLKFQFETVREDNGIKEGIIHFFSYDENNQPYHLFRTSIYITEEDCQNIISKLQLIFSLDKNQPIEYSAN